MIGFVTTEERAIIANSDVSNAQTNRGLPVFWLPGLYRIYYGEYTGMFFVPCDDEVMQTPLRGNPPLRPVDFPEFQEIIEELGGLDARVEISESDITRPYEHPN